MGETEVGKTSLLEYFVNGQAASHTPTTPGASFMKKQMVIDDNCVNFQLWDTAGQERFRAIAPMYYRGADAVLLVYEVGSQRSFLEIEKYWLEEVRSKSSASAVVFVVQNKCDIPAEDRQTSDSVCEAFARENGVRLFKTSGKTGEGIAEMFVQVYRDVVQRAAQREDQPKPAVIADDESQQGGCCM